MKYNQGQPDIKLGDLVTFEDGTDNPSALLITDICEDVHRRDIYRGMWSNGMHPLGRGPIAPMRVIRKGYGEMMSGDVLRMNLLNKASGCWTREGTIVRIWK
jgi:hypothetical protein